MNVIRNRSVNALLARGVCSELAISLVSAGHTVRSLKSRTLSELNSLGLTGQVAKDLMSGRPPIPEGQLLKLLFDNKWVCCVCRSPRQSIIVHHIEPWAKSRSHDLDNLVVLCPNDHARAHSKGEITQNLTAKALKTQKHWWEQKVKHDDNAVIRKAAQTVGEYWYFFNLLRLHEIAEHENIHLSSLPHYMQAHRSGVLDEDGHLVPEEADSTYAYSGKHSQLRYYYAKDLFIRVLNKLSVTNISDRLDRGDLGNTIIRNDVIYVEGAHNFTQRNQIAFGPDQLVTGSRTANSVRVEFNFDRWYATSNSANSVWLTGRKVVGSFCRVGDVSRDSDKKTIVLTCTVLAICAELPDLRTRSYVSPSAYQSWDAANEPC